MLLNVTATVNHKSGGKWSCCRQVPSFMVEFQPVDRKAAFWHSGWTGTRQVDLGKLGVSADHARDCERLDVVIREIVDAGDTAESVSWSACEVINHGQSPLK